VAPKKSDAERDELGQALFDAREAAGVRQAQAAAVVDMRQSKISRIEHKQGYLLTPEQATSLLSLYRVHGEGRRRILAMIEASRTEHLDARVILQSGAHHFQERLRLLAEEARQIWSFVPNAAIGYLQTAAYMRVVFTQRMTDEEAEPSIRKRVEQQRLMDSPDRQWVMIQTEGALRWNVGGPTVMADQVDRIAAAIDRPNVKLGFIPWYTPVDFVPMTGFHIYDRRAVVVGTWSGTAIIRHRAGIEMYEGLFARVSRLAVFGDDARAELQRIADEYRRLK
jgi:transcriptional regulator with XRE-family HTH domain